MDNAISIILGIPKHGWLPVNFNYHNFHLDFDASDVLNDPIEELYDAITKLKDKESKQITWWLEPGAYFFDIEKRGKNTNLTITETEDLYKESTKRHTLLTITVESKQIIEPFRKALKEFCSQTYEQNDWPYNMDKNKLESL